MASNDILQSKVESLYIEWQKLSLDSPDDMFQNFALNFSENATAWLLSMRELKEPSIGRESIIQGLKAALRDSQVIERHITAGSTIDAKHKVFLESFSTVKVFGKTLDRFPETTVVQFNDEGLIVDFKIYSCRSPIVEAIQEATGEGPYERHKHCA